MNAIKDDVISLVEKELKAANEKFPPFNSAHEGYAVIKEEVEEAEELINQLKTGLNFLWISIKQNQTYIDMQANDIKTIAIDAATELIQVAAMAQKFMDMKGVREDE